MFIDPQYKELVEKKYSEAKAAGNDELVLDEGTLGGLSLFIGKRPKMVLSTFVMEDGTEVYIGAESVKTVS